MRNAAIAMLIPIAAVSCGQSGLAVNQSEQKAAPEARAVEDRIYRGTCDGSAAMMLDADHFAAAYDEDNFIRVFPLAGGTASQPVDVAQHLGITNGKEADIEGAARIGGRIFWIGSHGMNEDGTKAKPERRRLFATTIGAGGAVEVSGSPSAAAGSSLFDALLDAFGGPPLNLRQAAQTGAKLPGGLNIEGLAATARNGLIIGLRNPLIGPDNAAPVIFLANPEEVIDGRGAPRFEGSGTIRLGGRGIRSLEFVPGRGDYLILAGAIDGRRDFALYRWSGRLEDEPVRLPMDFGSLNPEGLTLLPDGRVLILSDDGTERVNGLECKDEDTPPERRSFRGRIVAID